MKFVGTNDVRTWFAEAHDLSEFSRGFGRRSADDTQQSTLGLPEHLEFVLRRMASESDDALPAAALDSIPFYSLCRGLFLPLSMMDPDRAAVIFGLSIPPPPDSTGREALLQEFFEKEIGLSISEKLGCVLGDVFLGKRSTMRRDSLLRLLLTTKMMSRNECLDRLAQVGDSAILFAESRQSLRSERPLTAAEVIRTLRFIPTTGRTQKFSVLRSLLARCGKLEAYFLAKLMLRNAGLGFEYQGPLISRLLGETFGVSAEQITHAMALTDAFRVVEVLREKGAAGLTAIQLQPLVPIRPMLAGGAVSDLEDSALPVWVERKYDGIRLMLHKSTDTSGAILCGAYTRNRGDWLEQIPGMNASIQALPAVNAIVDGELFGTMLDVDSGSRPASVYEVYAALQGQMNSPVTLKFAAFDLIYLNGRDLTSHSLSERRQMLMMLLRPLSGMPLPIPFSVSEGQMAQSRDDLNRLFQHFRAQGYEGIITKDLKAPYRLAVRDPEWRKRKPEVTLDLAILGAVRAVTTKQKAGIFGSYVIGARNASGGFDMVGDVAGVDRVREADIHREIMRDGLMTGERIERPSASGARPGVALRPSIVVTTKFEGITRDQVTGQLSLRDPKIAVIRSDKSASEADTVATIEEMYLRQRVS